MKKRVRMAGRYLLLYCILFGAAVGLITLAMMPPWMARAGGCVGAAWWAGRYVLWSIERRAHK